MSFPANSREAVQRIYNAYLTNELEVSSNSPPFESELDLPSVPLVEEKNEVIE